MPPKATKHACWAECEAGHKWRAVWYLARDLHRMIVSRVVEPKSCPDCGRNWDSCKTDEEVGRAR